MFHLLWSWPTFVGIAVLGGIVGYFLWPSLWPNRAAEHLPAPTPVVLTVAIGTVGAFALFLAMLRAATSVVVELQASVLLVCYVVAAWAGLVVRGEK